MIDKVVIVNMHLALIIFVGDRHPVSLTSDRDIREMVYWFFDINVRLVNDDITQKIDLYELEKAS